MSVKQWVEVMESLFSKTWPPTTGSMLVSCSEIVMGSGDVMVFGVAISWTCYEHV